MKILIVSNDYYNNSNGMCISTQRFVGEFRKMGLEVRVCTNDRYGVPDYPLGVLRVPVFAGIIEKEGYTFAKTDRQVIRKGVEWADLVHIEDGFPLCAAAAKLANQLGKPCTGTYHLFPENMTYAAGLGWCKPLTWMIYRYFRTTYDRCRMVQCPTETVKERLIKMGHRSKLRVISNGILPESIAPCQAEKPEPFREKFVILTIGRLSTEKNQVELIKAIGISKYADRIQLIIAGKGPLEEELRRLGSTLPNAPVIRFFSQAELKTVKSYADLYVHCATVEIEGMSAMEAFAAGIVPVIADAKLSGTRSYALDGRCLYHSGSAEDLAAKIDYWIENTEERLATGKRYAAFAETLTLRASAEKLAKVNQRRNTVRFT